MPKEEKEEDRKDLIQFPNSFPTLNEKTIQLRQLKNKDAKSISILLTPEVSTYLKAEIPNLYGIEQAKKFIKYSHRRFKAKKSLIFAIELKPNQDKAMFVGIISLGNIDFVNKNSEIGYWIGKEFWQRGITTKSLSLVTSYSFFVLKLHKIYAHVFSENLSSKRILEKCNFKKEGELFEHRYKNDKFHNVLLYGIINKK